MFHRRFLHFITLALCTFMSASYAADVSIRADSWPPFNGEAGSDRLGYGIELYQAILEADGDTLNYQNMPWTRAIDQARKGAHDGIIGAVISDAEDFVFPKESIGSLNNAFYVKNGHQWKFKDISSLKDIKLGVIDGYSYGEELDTYIAAGKGIFVAKGDEALERLVKMVKAGRVDAIIEDQTVLAAFLQETGHAGTLTDAGKAGEPDNLYIAFGPNSPNAKKLADQFDAGMKKIRANGELAKILAKYGLTDWAP